jgi:hypothetical protein
MLTKANKTVVSRMVKPSIMYGGGSLKPTSLQLGPRKSKLEALKKPKETLDSAQLVPCAARASCKSDDDDQILEHFEQTRLGKQKEASKNDPSVQAKVEKLEKELRRLENKHQKDVVEHQGYDRKVYVRPETETYQYGQSEDSY